MPSTTIDDLVECEQCGASVPGTRTVNEQDLCTICAQDYVRCAHCTRWTDEPQDTTDGSVCGRCADWYYDKCEQCECLSSDTVATADGTRVCDTCATDYWPCESCCELIDSGDYCTSCARDDDLTAGGLIHDYSYKPAPDFHGAGSLYLGLELEVSTEDGQLIASAETAADQLRTIGYLKADCSINESSGYGFEIVTHPMSYDWAIEHFPWRMLGKLGQSGCYADGNGLHVHISRAGFDSPSHVYRWMKFLYRNQDRMVTIARRVSDQWAAFDARDRQHVKDYAKGAAGNRYSAINTQNLATFELRMFASSLDPQEVQAALGLAAASVEYTRSLTVPDIVWSRGWDWSAFVIWLEQHPSYGPLLTEMEELECAC